MVKGDFELGLRPLNMSAGPTTVIARRDYGTLQEPEASLQVQRHRGDFSCCGAACSRASTPSCSRTQPNANSCICKRLMCLWIECGQPSAGLLAPSRWCYI